MQPWLLSSLFLVSVTAQAVEGPTTSQAAIVSYVDPYSALRKTDASERILSHDFSNLLTSHQTIRYGFIGKDFQRFDIYFTAVKKDAADPRLYHVRGKTRVKSNVCDFEGTLRMVEARLWKQIDVCEDEPEPKMQGVAFFSYVFEEDRGQKGSGVFQGYAASRWRVGRSGALEYDIKDCEDGSSNNSFVGTWRGYSSRSAKVCNWGEYRIPYCGDLDNGADGFAPSEKYTKFGWSTFDPDRVDHWWE